MKDEKLIAGLGNPGAQYEKTRHNLGFMVVRALAEKHGLTFGKGWRVKGQMAQGSIGDVKVRLLLPTTYMNLSGESVAKALAYHQIPLQQFVVVADDIYLNFGVMRFREKGSAGGHNGLKSIEARLGKQDYLRLRMGIGPYDQETFGGPLDEFVLAPFSKEEVTMLPQILEKGVALLERWISHGIETNVTT